MFVKLLTLLFYNIFVSFSVLVCSRSFNRNCGLTSLSVRLSAQSQQSSARSPRSSVIVLELKRL